MPDRNGHTARFVIERFIPLTYSTSLYPCRKIDKFSLRRSKLQDIREIQGHHHNGDQAVRRPHMMCSICGRRFAIPWLGTWESEMGLFDSPPTGSY